jgi:hypothetical protein
MSKILPAIALATATIGCGAKFPGLGSGGGSAPVPQIRVAAVTLGAHPTNAMLAAYYCAEAAGGGLAGMACRVLGDVPSKADLKFTFQVQLEATNPSSLPMPVVSALLAFSAYPADSGGQNLGAVCVEMCKDPNNCPQAGNACDSSDPLIKSPRDFAGAAAGFLIASALSGGPKVELTMPVVDPGKSLAFVASLSLGIDQMLSLIKRASGEAIASARKGKQPTFAIPWSVEGSVWVRFEGFGRIGASFPRQAGEWQLQ